MPGSGTLAAIPETFMGELISIERCWWFDRQIKDNLYPNATTLADQFELSAKTAQRTINFLRDRFDAPLAYDPLHRGYYYSDPSFSLFAPGISQNELLAILIARNLLAGSGGAIAEAIASFGRKLFASMHFLGLDEAVVAESFSAVWNGFSPAEAEVFGACADALLHRRPLSFCHYSPDADRLTERTVEPHHLQHYQGNWVLLAYCRLRNDWRKFHLARIRTPQLQTAHFEPRPRAEWQPLLEGTFGIFQGGTPELVTLRFSPYRARWIRDEFWHREQQFNNESDGSLLLSFPVADFREVTLRILQYGADVEVLAPDRLRAEIAGTAARLFSLYAKNSDC